METGLHRTIVGRNLFDEVPKSYLRGMKYTALVFLILCSSCSVRNSADRWAAAGNARDILQRFKEGTLVVRVPTQGKKRAYLRQALSQKQAGSPERIRFAAMLETARAEDELRFERISSAFHEFYTFSRVAFVPDSLYGAFLQGRKNVFVENAQAEPVTKDVGNDVYLWLALDHELQFGLFQYPGNRLPDPLPYRKNSFLPAFKRWLTPEKYIDNQVKWLQERLTSLLPHP